MRRHDALIADLLHACANPAVAEAALATLRRESLDRVRDAAALDRQPSGDFVAAAVRRFADRSDSAAAARVARRMAKAQMPLIAGLQAILDERAHDPDV
jgi:hypothetical protein